FMQSYSYSRAAVEKVLAENPSIRVVLDVHRDSIVSNGVEFFPVTEVEGKEAAQVMIVCGTNAKGLEHPDWRKNFVYGLELSRRMGKLYGELSRPVNLRTDRFNTHFTPHTLLLEVGSAANTLDQAIYGGELTAAAMIDLWNNT
ncbi:MAG: stage II sporulation protein P, partial [Clostridia bacterium]|nr:stage II sporulation protein P [Clostridia bacterium]